MLLIMCSWLFLDCQKGSGVFQQCLWEMVQFMLFFSQLLKCLCLMLFGIQLIFLFCVSILFVICDVWMYQFFLVKQRMGLLVWLWKGQWCFKVLVQNIRLCVFMLVMRFLLVFLKNLFCLCVICRMLWLFILNISGMLYVWVIFKFFVL